MFLINKIGNLFFETKNSSTLLLSCKQNDCEAAENELIQGADPNVIQSHYLESRVCPLFWALYHQNKNLFEILIKYGAKTSKNGRFHLTIKQHPQTLFKLALPLLYLFPELLSPFLESGAKDELNFPSTNYTNYNQPKIEETILHTAIRDGQLEFAKLLLQNGAKVNNIHFSRNIFVDTDIDTIEETELTLTMALTNMEETKIVDFIQILLTYGVNVNITKRIIPRQTTHFSESHFVAPLHLAMTRNNPKLVQLLLVAGAKLDSKSYFPLHDCEYNAWELCEHYKNMKEVLSSDFSPSLFRFATKPVRLAIISVLIIAKRECWILGNDILFHIFTHLVRLWDQK